MIEHSYKIVMNTNISQKHTSLREGIINDDNAGEAAETALA